MKIFEPYEVLEKQINEDIVLIEEIDLQIKQLEHKKKIINGKIAALKSKQEQLFEEKQKLKIAVEILEGDK